MIGKFCTTPSLIFSNFVQLRVQVREVETILSDFAQTNFFDPISFVSLQTLKIDLPELQEIDTMAIAKNKALLAAQLANGPCLVEDTSLHFHALGGMPGPYIKWFQDKLKSGGLYNILAAYDDKTATAVCTLAFSPAPHADPVLFTGMSTKVSCRYRQLKLQFFSH